MTRVQKAILQTVRDSGMHLSAEDVYALVKKHYPRVSLATIYRNLNRFADQKLLNRLLVTDGPHRFEANSLPHDHCFCAECGSIFDIRLPRLKHYLKEQIGCKILSFTLTVNCVCDSCAKKDGQPADMQQRHKATDKQDKAD